MQTLASTARRRSNFSLSLSSTTSLKTIPVPGGKLGSSFHPREQKYMQSRAHMLISANNIIPHTDRLKLAASGSLRSRGPSALPYQLCLDCPCKSPGRPLHSTSFGSAAPTWRLCQGQGPKFHGQQKPHRHWLANKWGTDWVKQSIMMSSTVVFVQSWPDSKNWRIIRFLASPPDLHASSISKVQRWGFLHARLTVWIADAAMFS